MKHTLLTLFSLLFLSQTALIADEMMDEAPLEESADGMLADESIPEMVSEESTMQDVANEAEHAEESLISQESQGGMEESTEESSSESTEEAPSEDELEAAHAEEAELREVGAGEEPIEEEPRMIGE